MSWLVVVTSFVQLSFDGPAGLVAVHVRAGGEIECEKTNAVHDRSDGDNVRRGQAGGAPQALIAVAEGNVDELNVGH